MAKAGANDGENGRYAPWCEDVAAVVAHLRTDVEAGLSADEAERRAAQYGPNELTKEPPTPLWRLVLEQFDDALVKMLLVAALVSFVIAVFEDDPGEAGLRAFVEPFVILLILVLNAIVGVWQEANAESALEALKEMQPAETRCVRGGELVAALPARSLVPGDVVHLAVGDKVPADCRLAKIYTATLRAEQSSLTGESVAMMKMEEAAGQPGSELQAQESMLFAGTAVANGSCTAIVTATGMRTEMGKIQADIAAAAGEDDDTPLKKKLNDFGNLLARVIAVICVVVWAINYHHFASWRTDAKTGLPEWGSFRFSFRKATYYFKIAVALAVAAIPEGLPAVITTCLALGTRKMAQQNAIIRRLPSVETLGCTTVICSDKTGTLTTNQMSAVRVVTAAAAAASGGTRELAVAGSSYNPDEAGAANGELRGLDDTLDAALDAVAAVCAVCNQAALAVDDAGAHRCVGEPTEGALLVLAEKLGVGEASLNGVLGAQRRRDAGAAPMPATEHRRSNNPTRAVLEFDRSRKSMSVIVRDGRTRSSDATLLVKGAAEFVLARCTHALLPGGERVALDAALRAAIDASVHRMATQALRCLAVATRDLAGTDLATYDGSHSHPGHARLQDLSQYEAIESGLTFAGLVGLQDPPRAEVAGAIAACGAAGIRVVVITGDNKDTAEAICKAIGVFTDATDLGAASLTGRDYAALDSDAQKRLLASPDSLCFSRAEPRHKQDLVRQLKALGEIVAMTGDGVNDAPALKLADIGVAMGVAGTEVAKEASDMVLADDNFRTIVAAVREGRGIFDNMKAFIRYMISSNIGEVFCIFFTALLGMPEGLIPVQLLWVNLVTDGPPATALGFNPPDKGVMQRRPRDPREPLITAWVFFRYLVVGAYVGVATVGVFAVWYTRASFLGIPLAADGHTPITFAQLRRWEDCPAWPEEDFAPALSYGVAGGGAVAFAERCAYFTAGKVKPCTLSLTVLVAIEMFNALNALSEDGSLLSMPPWSNPWLLLAGAVSFALHFLILYVPFLASVFSIVPLTANEWLLVLAFAAPVILIDEVLKLVGRVVVTPAQERAKAAAYKDKHV